MWEFRQALLSDPSYDLFGVAESRLGPEVDDHLINVHGYSALRQDRNLSGGGVILYVKDNLKAKILHSSDTTQRGKPLRPEYLLGAVWEGNAAPTLVALVYRPPDVSLRADRKFVRLLRSTCSNYSHKIIMGDWNADMLDSDSSDSSFVRILIDELSLKLVETGPTHHTANNDTWIDIY